MKFKGNPGWREASHTDKAGDDLIVSITPDRVYVLGQSCSLSHKRARGLALNILKEIGE
jgi:hypothetical protein